MFDKIYTLVHSIYRNGARSEEFSMIIDEFTLTNEMKDLLMKVFEGYERRIDSINNLYEDENALKMATFKKFPLNLGISDDNVSVSEGKIVDIEWKLLHQIGSTYLNKIFEPKIFVKLTVLTDDFL